MKTVNVKIHGKSMQLYIIAPKGMTTNEARNIVVGAIEHNYSSYTHFKDFFVKGEYKGVKYANPLTCKGDKLKEFQGV